MLPPSLEAAGLPEVFPYPFHYEPHPVAKYAAGELVRELEKGLDLRHDFGLRNPEASGAIGKMFGVLVVRTSDGQLAYLRAFSGKIGGEYHQPGFVPPIFDLYGPDSFYPSGERALNDMNARIASLEARPEIAESRRRIRQLQKYFEDALAEQRTINRERKKVRKERRAAAAQLSEAERSLLEKELSRESVAGHFAVKDLKRRWKEKIKQAEEAHATILEEINALKAARKAKSANLQNRIFSEYRFLNARGEFRDLSQIFRETPLVTPPAGAGDCAAPKLLHFAYRHGLTPLGMAEFWWGKPPRNALRRHLNYYPACRGKCGPILGHMLEGLSVAPDPLQEPMAGNLEMDIVYEDDDLVVLNKPAGLLSVPGKQIDDSVLTRLRKRYPEASGPLLVHRLDMATSGLLLAAKRAEVHKELQKLFLKRTISKRYVARLSQDVRGDRGVIDLPLRQDYLERPRQMVCWDEGKVSRTVWEVLEREEKSVVVRLEPITGRTHQLRVHAAHPEGLNAPIYGDALYGTRADRLHLHAAEMSFLHPVTKVQMKFHYPAPFYDGKPG
ncbi:RNA pseudouridine synthase [Lewinella sp. W8]|nr:RNA pseudouridine synthase [Lewinella sp. W8]